MTVPPEVAEALTMYYPHEQLREQNKVYLSVIENFCGGSVEPLIEVLKAEPFGLHYGAMIVLRKVFDLEIWAQDSDDRRTMWYQYRRSPNDAWRFIKPANGRDYAKEAEMFGLKFEDYAPRKRPQ